MNSLLNNNLREIKDKILLKSAKKDKNNKDYLLLELENGEIIFVFNNHTTPPTDWEKLKEGKKYVFTTKEGKIENSKILVEFEEESDVFAY